MPRPSAIFSAIAMLIAASASATQAGAAPAASASVTGGGLAADASTSATEAGVAPVARTSARDDAVLQAHALGLHPGSDFRLATGKCTDCAAIPQALWYFQNEVIAVPKAGLPVEGFSTTQRGADDVRTWANTPQVNALTYPGVAWLGAPNLISTARLASDGKQLTMPDGAAIPLLLAPKIASNSAYFDASSTAFFAQRPVRVRGSGADTPLGGTSSAANMGKSSAANNGAKRGAGGDSGSGAFTARTLWPTDYTIARQGMAVQPLGRPDSLRSFVRAENGGAKSAYATRLIWERHAGAASSWQGKPVLGIMLNGAQGDDDESLAGHFAIATGRVGQDGGMADWLVNNYYTLDAWGEKGTIAGIVPMDNYLADLNSGQAYYRPSYMLVAVLSNARTAQAYEGGAQRLYNHYYRHDFLFDGARDNCTGMSMDVFDALGWHVPHRGPTHALKALAAYPYKAITEGSLLEGRKAYDYLNEEQIRLYPAVAFEAAGEDLLQLLAGTTTRTLSAYERQLQTDVEALVLVRIPQIPSSRVFGSAPVYSYDEYMDRTPPDHADWKVIPVPPRPFPAALKDGLALSLPERSVLPWQVALAGSVVLLLLAGAALLIRRRIKSQRLKRRLPCNAAATRDA